MARAVTYSGVSEALCNSICVRQILCRTVSFGFFKFEKKNLGRDILHGTAEPNFLLCLWPETPYFTEHIVLLFGRGNVKYLLIHIPTYKNAQCRMFGFDYLLDVFISVKEIKKYRKYPRV